MNITLLKWGINSAQFWGIFDSPIGSLIRDVFVLCARVRGLVVECSDQNLTPVRITTHVQRQEHEEALKIPIRESQPRLNPMAALNHSSESILSLTLESELVQPPRADSTPDRTPCHAVILHHHGQIEANFFES